MCVAEFITVLALIVALLCIMAVLSRGGGTISAQVHRVCPICGSDDVTPLRKDRFGCSDCGSTFSDIESMGDGP